MGAGIFLLMVGAVLAFAVRTDSDVVDLQIVGLILIVGGIASIYHARSGSTSERHVTKIEDLSDPQRVIHTVHESVTEQDPNDPYPHPRA